MRYGLECTKYEVRPIYPFPQNPTEGVFITHQAAQIDVVSGEDHAEVARLLGG